MKRYIWDRCNTTQQPGSNNTAIFNEMLGKVVKARVLTPKMHITKTIVIAVFRTQLESAAQGRHNTDDTESTAFALHSTDVNRLVNGDIEHFSRGVWTHFLFWARLYLPEAFALSKLNFYPCLYLQPVRWGDEIITGGRGERNSLSSHGFSLNWEGYNGKCRNVGLWPFLFESSIGRLRFYRARAFFTENSMEIRHLQLNFEFRVVFQRIQFLVSVSAMPFSFKKLFTLSERV